MIGKTKGTLFTAFFILVMISISLSNAYAADMQVSVPEGTAVPGCEETNECYIPASVSVNPGDTVTWSNDDTAAHTVTSGSAADGPDGIFDSSLFMAGTTYEHTFDTLGEYPYFCMVHPWMVGTVLVTPGGGVEVPLGTITIDEDSMADNVVVTGMSMDGSVRVEVTSGIPTFSAPLPLEVRFRDASGGGLKDHVNYDLIVTQNGDMVLRDVGMHEHEGMGMHEVPVLATEDPVDIEITLHGFGLPDDEANWTGPKGEILQFNVVPEFGTIAMLILGVAIFSIIALSAKTKVIPRL